MPSKVTTPRPCKTCGALFYPWRQHVKNGRGLFCSPDCYHGPRLPLQHYDDGTVGIPLQARDGALHGYAVVDAADAEWANQWRWHLHPGGYAARSVKVDNVKQTIMLHRALLGLKHGDPMTGDHIDRSTLNNRRSNLRLATQAQQMQNVPGRGGTSSYRGVTRRPKSGRWYAIVYVSGKKHHLGSFSTEEEAADAARAGRQRLLTHAVD